MSGRGCANGYGKDAMPRTVNTITGPSRTGDIEQAMELGAHGPRRMHIIVVPRMTAAGGAPPPRRGELRIVGTSVAREIELLLDRVAETVGRRAPRVLQIGSRSSVLDRNERNWRALISKRFGNRAHFIGVDLAEGSNVDRRLDICSPPKAI